MRTSDRLLDPDQTLSLLRNNCACPMFPKA